MTLVADRLTEEDAAELERLVRRKGDILTDDNAPPFAAEETATFERLLGKAAGDEGLFEQRRRDAAARATLDNLGDVRRVAKLPRQPLLAEPGSVQLPRFAVHDWLVGPEAHEGAWTVLDLGLLVVIRGCFANRDATPFVGGQFEETDGDLVLVIPGGIGSEVRLRGQIGGDPVLPDGPGFIRTRPALNTLVRNEWIEVERTVAETRIRLGSNARELANSETDVTGS